MKYVLEVCLVAFVAGSLALVSGAQTPAMQTGVSVEMVPTRNASPMPNADREDAFIVSVAANGAVYLGTNPISLPQLTEKTRSTPFKRDQALYIKADARAPYTVVLPVLEATNTAGLLPQVLLTSQRGSESAESGTIIPPEGLKISVGSTFPAGTTATLVQLLPSGQEQALLKINNDTTPWSDLEITLSRHFQNGDSKVVLLSADPRLPFAAVVQAIDRCRAAGAKVYLAASGR
jgi:biopolymer transport protein ExbD